MKNNSLDRLLNITDNTISMINSAKKQLSNIEYSRGNPESLEYQHSVLAMTFYLFQEEDLKLLEDEYEKFESEKLTNIELEELAKIKDNVIILKDTRYEMFKILMAGKIHDMYILGQKPDSKFILDVLSKRIVIPKDTDEEKIFTVMLCDFFRDIDDEDFHPVKEPKEEDVLN